MSILQEFKTFAVKGNVVDMAVGVVVGAAFGKIVTSFVNDIITPPIGLLIGGVDFRDLALTLKPAVGDAGAVVLAYGKFMQTMFDFIIVAFAIFLAVKIINRLRASLEKPVDVSAPVEPAPSKEVLLLAEIRDLLKDHK